VFDIGYLAAFLGGLLVLISPCSALLLPSFFAYAFGGPTRLLGRTGVFFLGLAAVLVPLGAGSGALAAQLTEHRAALIVMAGWAIIALGVVQMLGGGWSVRPAARIQAQMAARGTWVATAGLGAAYGLAGFCTGPILGAVLTVAAAGGDPVHGALLLGVYALGMAAPLLVLTVLWQRFDLSHRTWLRGKMFHIGPVRLHTTSTISGLLFVTIGALFVVFNGSAGLLTLDPRSALKLEDATATLAAHVPDVALLVTLAAVVVTILVYRLRTHASHQVHAPTPLPTSTTPASTAQPPEGTLRST
jgi:cytochrome c biogenesis protein CcdA